MSWAVDFPITRQVFCPACSADRSGSPEDDDAKRMYRVLPCTDKVACRKRSIRNLHEMRIRVLRWPAGKVVPLPLP